jgi:hypothetical protein
VSNKFQEKSILSNSSEEGEVEGEERDHFEKFASEKDLNNTYTIEEEVSSFSQSSFISLGLVQGGGFGRMRSKSYQSDSDPYEEEEEVLSDLRKFASNTPIQIPQVKEVLEEMLE